MTDCCGNGLDCRSSTTIPAEVPIGTADPELFNPPDMRQAIDANLRSAGGKPPADQAGYTRLICDSLGNSVGVAVRKFSRMTGQSFDNIVVVGGGSKNRLLCQRMADFSGLNVTSYYLEATSVGNMAYQFLGLGAVDSLSAFHELILPGLQPTVYEPRG